MSSLNQGGLSLNMGDLSLSLPFGMENLPDVWNIKDMETKREVRTFLVEPAYTELVTPDRFLRLYKAEKDNIQFVRIIPASLGSKNFGGRLLIKRKTPVYRTPFRSAIK